MTSGHLVQEAGEAIAAALDKVDGVEMLYLGAAEKADALVQLACLDKDRAAPPASPAEGDAARMVAVLVVAGCLVVADRLDQ